MKQIRYEKIAPAVNSILAIVAALVAGGIVLFAIGKNPFLFYQQLFTQGMGTSLGLTESIIKMAPLLLLSAGLLIAFSANLWNIGGDGQLLLGAMLVGWLGPILAPYLSVPSFVICMALLGIVGGMAWTVLPAVLKARYNLNEIILTLMMNFLAINLVTWLAKGPIRDPTISYAQTALFPMSHRMPGIPFTRIHVGVIGGLIAILGVHWMIKRTTMGYSLRVLGTNKYAAIYAGMNVRRITMWALLVSGAFAGLAGVNDIMGIKGQLQGGWNPGYTFTCVPLVFLARMNGWAVIPLAFFFSFLGVGGEFVARDLGIPIFFVHVLEGLMLLFFAASEYIEKRTVVRRVG